MANISKWEIIFAICAGLGIVAGFSGFIAFVFILHNTQAGIWAIISGSYAFAYMILLVLQVRDSIDQWYATPHLCNVAILGSIGIISSTTAFVSYLALAIFHHEQFPTMATIGGSRYIMAIWAALALKWSITLTLYARTLTLRLRGGYQSI